MYHQDEKSGAHVDDIYDDYREWCRKNGEPAWDASTFFSKEEEDWKKQGAVFDRQRLMVHGMPYKPRVYRRRPRQQQREAPREEPAAPSKPQPDRSQDIALALRSIGVYGKVTSMRPGPVITVYDFEAAPGVRLEKVLKSGDEVATKLRVKSAIPRLDSGRGVVCFEVENQEREVVSLRKLMNTPEWRKPEHILPLPLGRKIDGTPSIWDLARMPHLLVAGATGAGKSVGLNAMLLSLLERHTPQTMRLVLIDPKRVELSVFSDIPHLWTPIATTPAKALASLNWVIREMEQRYTLLAAEHCRNLDRYNTKAAEKGFEPLPRIIVVIDEAANLMAADKKRFEGVICRLAAEARAAGIHLIVATQRPSVDVITGTIKANLPYALAYTCTRVQDSRTIIQEAGAEKLLGNGDAIISADGDLTRIHGPFVSDEEVEDVADKLRAQGCPDYVFVGEDFTVGGVVRDEEFPVGADEVEDPVFDATPMGEGGEAVEGEDTSGQTAIEFACRWLKKALAEGPRPGDEVVREAEQVGIKRTTLDRAADKYLGVKKSGGGFGKAKTWSLL